MSTTRESTPVLIVDDDPFQIELLTEQLRSLGYQTIKGIHDGVEAEREIRSRANYYRLVALDLSIPRQDGFELIEALVSAGYSGSLIIISGQDPEVLHAAKLVATLRRVPLLGVLAKPVSRKSLSDLLAGA